MKYLITESQLDDTMEKLLKKLFPEVISVSSRPVNVYIADEEKSVTRTKVTVICDTDGYVTNLSSSTMTDYDLNKSIRRTLHDYFNIDYGYIVVNKLTLVPLVRY